MMLSQKRKPRTYRLCR